MTVGKGTRRAKRRSSVASVCRATPAEIDVPGTAIEGDGVELDGSSISSPQALRKRAEAIGRLDQTESLFRQSSPLFLPEVNAVSSDGNVLRIRNNSQQRNCSSWTESPAARASDSLRVQTFRCGISW